MIKKISWNFINITLQTIILLLIRLKESDPKIVFYHLNWNWIGHTLHSKRSKSKLIWQHISVIAIDTEIHFKIEITLTAHSYFLELPVSSQPMNHFPLHFLHGSCTQLFPRTSSLITTYEPLSISFFARVLESEMWMIYNFIDRTYFGKTYLVRIRSVITGSSTSLQIWCIGRSSKQSVLLSTGEKWST